MSAERQEIDRLCRLFPKETEIGKALRAGRSAMDAVDRVRRLAERLNNGDDRSELFDALDGKS